MVLLRVEDPSSLPPLLRPPHRHGRPRSVAFHSGGSVAYTAEALRFERRQSLHDQLRLARRLRAILEAAADEAERDDDPRPPARPTHSIGASSPPPSPPESRRHRARRILDHHRCTIDELTSLTEAVRGNYVLESYGAEYTLVNAERDRVRAEAVRNATDNLRTHLFDMARERNPDAFASAAPRGPPRVDADVRVIDMETRHPRARAIALGHSAASSASSGVGTESPADSSSRKDDDRAVGGKGKAAAATAVRAGIMRKFGPVESGAAAAAVAEDERKSHEGRSAGHSQGESVSATTSVGSKDGKSGGRGWGGRRTKRPPAAGAPAQDGGGTASLEPPPSKKGKLQPHRWIKKEEKASHAGKAAAKMPSIAAKTAASAPAAKASKGTKPTAKRQKKASVPRRCHQCRSVTPDVYRCQYWLPSGSKCGKSYCVACLSSDYDGAAAPNDDEWHCPSCLGSCKCALCVNQREREKRREEAAKAASKAVGTRVMGRRSAGRAS